MSSDLAVLAQRSDTGPGAKSMLRKFYEKVTATTASAKTHALATGHAVRQGGEALVVGGALGALHAELATGLDVKKVPIDAAVAAGAMVAGIAFANEDVSKDLLNAGSAAAAVYAFRKSHDWMAQKKLSQGQIPGSTAAKASSGKATMKGESWANGGYNNPGYVAGGAFGADTDEDPIIQAARLL